MLAFISFLDVRYSWWFCPIVMKAKKEDQIVDDIGEVILRHFMAFVSCIIDKMVVFHKLFQYVLVSWPSRFADLTSFGVLVE